MNLLAQEMVSQKLTQIRKDLETQKQLLIATNEYADKVKSICVESGNSYLCGQLSQQIYQQG